MNVSRWQFLSLVMLVTCGTVFMAGCNTAAIPTDASTLLTASKKVKNEAPKLTKLVPFEHDKELDTYLNSVCGFLLEIPKDGRFGYSRVEPVGLHATRTEKMKGYGDVQKLSAEYTIRTFVVGTKKPQSNLPSSPGLYYKIPPNPKLEASPVRMNEVLADQYKYFSSNLMQVRNPQPYEPELVDAVLKLKPILDAKGYDNYSEPITVKGIKGNLMSKSVRAPDDSCLRCHADLKPGKPIGYAMAMIWKKK